MATESVLQAVQHYQRSIEKNPNDVARLLHCVGKLYKLPITVGHLQETGVGRTVNALRKHNGELGVAAEAVVNKWKEIVASENDSRADDKSSSEDDPDDDNAGDNDDERSQRGKNTPATENNSQKPEKSNDKPAKENSNTKTRSPSNHERHDRHKSEHKDKDRPTSKEKQKKEHRSRHEDSSGKEKKDKSESSNHKRRKEEEKEKSSSEHVSKEERESKRHKHKSSREDDKKTSSDSSRHKSSSSGKHKDHDKHTEDKEKEKTKLKSHSHSKDEKHKKPATVDVTPPPSSTQTPTESSKNSASTSKRRYEDNNLNEQSPKKPKPNTSHESKRVNKQVTEKKEATEQLDEGDEGIDSSMGANFADVLGMLNMPQKKVKKSLSALKQTSPTSSSKKSEKREATSNEKTQTVSKLKTERDFDGPSTSSQIHLEKKPVLLNSNVKLAPLDPSIALELPVISNNYKPLPLNPTVMDCVFNSSTSSSSRAPPRMFSDAEALSHGISSKTIRTKVYSGVKSGQLFQVPSLFDLCIRILQKNIDALEYTGGVPFDVLRPVLERATPQQLFTFEEYNPYLMEDSDVLWQQHVGRTYRGKKREEMESWREMFMRCQEEQERRLNALAQNIKQSQKVMAEPVRKTQLAFVDSMVKPPRNVMRKQEQYGTKSKLVATPAARVAALSSVTPNAAKTGDIRLRTAAAVRFDPAQAAAAPSKPKKAPLMAKTLQFIRGRHRR